LELRGFAVYYVAFFFVGFFGAGGGVGLLGRGAVGGAVAAALRAADPPVIARVHDGRTVCDLRTVAPADDAHVAKALFGACAS
jgi:hypothetical protein